MTAIVRFVMAVIGILMLEIVMMVICDVDQDVIMMNGWTSKTLQISFALCRLVCDPQKICNTFSVSVKWVELTYLHYQTLSAEVPACP